MNTNKLNQSSTADASAKYTQITGNFADPGNPKFTELMTAIRLLPNRSIGDLFFYQLPSSQPITSNVRYVFRQTPSGFVREEDYGCTQ